MIQKIRYTIKDQTYNRYKDIRIRFNHWNTVWFQSNRYTDYRERKRPKTNQETGFRKYLTLKSNMVNIEPNDKLGTYQETNKS